MKYLSIGDTKIPTVENISSSNNMKTGKSINSWLLLFMALAGTAFYFYLKNTGNDNKIKI